MNWLKGVISLQIWTHEIREKDLQLDRPQRQAGLKMEEQFETEMSVFFKLGEDNCHGHAAMGLTWDTLKCYQSKRFKQKIARQTIQEEGDPKAKTDCHFRINIQDL